MTETDSTLAVRDTARGSKHRTIAAAIKGLFRRVAAAITKSEDEPKPKAKGRWDTGRAFAAAKVGLRPTQLPADISADAFNGIDWVNLWQANAEAHGDVGHEWNTPPPGLQL